jgi:hypothetical protein
VLRVPWYVAWPLALAAIYAALSFLARRSAFYPMKYPAGLWNLQAEVRGPRYLAADLRWRSAPRMVGGAGGRAAGDVIPAWQRR